MTSTRIAVEPAFASVGRERIRTRFVGEQVIALQVAGGGPRGSGQIVGVFPEPPAGSPGQVVHPAPAVEQFIAPVVQSGLKIGRLALKVIGGSNPGVHQPARIDGIHGYRRAVGQVGQLLEAKEDFRVVNPPLPVLRGLQQLESVGEQHDRLATRHVAKTANYVVQGTQRAGRKDQLAVLSGLGLGIAVPIGSVEVPALLFRRPQAAQAPCRLRWGRKWPLAPAR